MEQIFHPFSFTAPQTVGEVLQALQGGNGKALLMAGGTNLLVRLRENDIETAFRHGGRSTTQVHKQSQTFYGVEADETVEEYNVIGLGDVQGLNLIKEEDGGIVVGATANLTAVQNNAAIKEWWPALAGSASQTGGRQVQNMATLVGNIAWASPAADNAVTLIAYNAQVQIAGPAGSRVEPIDQFFQGPGRTALQPGELITGIYLPKPAPNAKSSFQKKGRVYLDIAKVNAAVNLEMDGDVCTGARVAVGACAPKPLRITRAEEALKGQKITDDLLGSVATIVSEDVSPITDVRSTAWYRRVLAGVLVNRAIKSALGKA